MVYLILSTSLSTIFHKTLLEMDMQQSAKLLVLGDISLHSFSQTQFKHSAAYVALVQRIKSYDGLTLANLECVLTRSKNLNWTKIALDADPALLCELPRIDLFSLANNHISDAWGEGVDDTVETLNQQKKTYFGYGRDLTDARKPALIEENGIRLGFLGYSCVSTNGENYATSIKPGVCPLTTEYLETDIPRLKNEVDHVIVVLHWGKEHVHYPTPDQIAVAHRAIDLGASAVVGMHPHVIQGVERYKGGFICYSLGNFIFSNSEYELLQEGNRVRLVDIQLRANKESLGVEFAFEKNRIRLNSVTAFKLDKHFLPAEVPLDRLYTNLSKLNTKLEAYVKENLDCLRKINGPQLVVRFANGKYGNHYLLKPINGYQTDVISRALKRLLVNTLYRVTRPFLRRNRSQT
jgi:Bacterial capsule synthesis protein PGA_cap